MIYKVGETVKVKSELECRRADRTYKTPGFCGNMFKWCNKKAIISKVVELSNGAIGYHIIGDTNYFWCENYFSPIKDKLQII